MESKNAEAWRKRVQEILLTLSFKVGSFTLSSGKTSDYYVDCRTTTLDPEGADLTARLLFERIRSLKAKVDAVGGLTLGADPMTAALIVRSWLEGSPIRGFIVRKEAKGHGRGRLVEGNLRKGDKVVILEDVVTTGGSALQAIAAAEAEGAKVVEVMAVVDREEGGREALEAKGYPLFALFTASELKAAAGKKA